MLSLFFTWKEEFFFIMKKKIDLVDKQPETGKHVGRNVERGTRPETIVVLS